MALKMYLLSNYGYFGVSMLICGGVCFERIPVPHLREFHEMYACSYIVFVYSYIYLQWIDRRIIELLDGIMYRLIGSLSHYF